MSFPSSFGINNSSHTEKANSAKKDIFLIVAVATSVVATGIFVFLTLLAGSFALGALASGVGAPAVVPAAVAALIFGGLAVGGIALTYYFFRKI